MQHFSTGFLIISLVIVVNQGSSVTAQDDFKYDQIAEESKHRAITIIDGPKYVQQSKPSQPQSIIPQSKTDLSTHKPEIRPPSKPPIKPDIPVKQKVFINIPRPYYRQIQKIPPPRHYHKPPLKLHHSPNSVYKYPKVIPLPPHHNKQFYVKSRPLVFAASTGRPAIVQSPKFSLPVQTINGIRTEFVKPPKHINTTTTTTTTDATTTKKVLRTKRIWPKRILEKINSTSLNTTETKVNTTKIDTNNTVYTTSESSYRNRYAPRNLTALNTTTVQPLTTRSYRPVTRAPKIKVTTAPTINFTKLEFNDWVPIVPSHFSKIKRSTPTPINKRFDIFPDIEAHNKRMLYLQAFGLMPVNNPTTPVMSRKKNIFFKKRRHLNPYYSGYSPKHVRSPPLSSFYGDLQTEGSHRYPRVVTKIKHHHHHHHHRYLKTVEKPVKIPYKVEVPKPYPVTVEKKVPVPVEKIKWVEKQVPYPVTVEKRIPYPIGIRVPHPVPVKVVEKEYVPKPFPIIHHVPILKHVEVKVPQPYPVQVEKRVPYPVEVKVPVDRPVPVQVEKKVPYPVPVKVLVPQPYPVETKVPYPVEVKVKEPYEVIKHVEVRVPYPYPVKVPYPVPVNVEKRVPYPVEVEKKVPVPYPVKVRVPHRVEVEKRIPVYVPRPYPVEKKVPVPVKVPYPVNVPIEVPHIIHNPYPSYSDDYSLGLINSPGNIDDLGVTEIPQHTVTVHGNTGFYGFQSRSDKPETESPTTVANNS